MEVHEIQYKIYRFPTNTPGGQHTGRMGTGMILECENLNLKIELETHRSQIRNIELLELLLDFAIMDLPYKAIKKRMI